LMQHTKCASEFSSVTIRLSSESLNCVPTVRMAAFLRGAPPLPALMVIVGLLTTGDAVRGEPVEPTSMLPFRFVSIWASLASSTAKAIK